MIWRAAQPPAGSRGVRQAMAPENAGAGVYADAALLQESNLHPS